ncbi:hypothetical protein APHNP_0663 [Anaplasma phagocytophilum str. ApNP]|uniref:Uncharacterized protein n=2 Tax=Anaplasma phagocytophilum TaxID=948 RepID=A0A0F3N898_ANAPH|nr:hypothetical protein APHMUC_0864 [Anaplasma phagocytophilum str. ApMUC09]KJV63956.1 hypothetical protein APHMUC_0819 [Anaplasma phagocytophilum str. ApMUC09]KJV66738.1 hypothetical protein APHNP_0663 [Anaplasma phagocytophilum str. ApNP]
MSDSEEFFAHEVLSQVEHSAYARISCSDSLCFLAGARVEGNEKFSV